MKKILFFNTSNSAETPESELRNSLECAAVNPRYLNKIKPWDAEIFSSTSRRSNFFSSFIFPLELRR
ncbi:hypothetical protein CP082626L3_0958A, partial [Chlamydia psittaci 08-2626_L3]